MQLKSAPWHVTFRYKPWKNWFCGCLSWELETIVIDNKCCRTPGFTFTLRTQEKKLKYQLCSSRAHLDTSSLGLCWHVDQLVMYHCRYSLLTINSVHSIQRFTVGFENFLFPSIYLNWLSLSSRSLRYRELLTSTVEKQTTQIQTSANCKGR